MFYGVNWKKLKKLNELEGIYEERDKSRKKALKIIILKTL